jgi:hypothetical protein
MCAYGGWLPPFWGLGNTELNCIRRCLVRSDTEERKKLPEARCKDCLPDPVVDRYHEKCYLDCQVSPRRYPGVNPPWLPWNPNRPN